MELSIANLKQLLAEGSSLGDKVLEFENDKSITAQGVDSLDMMDYYLSVEETYDVTIPDTDIDKVNTFDALYEYLKEHK